MINVFHTDTRASVHVTSPLSSTFCCERMKPDTVCLGNRFSVMYLWVYCVQKKQTKKKQQMFVENLSSRSSLRLGFRQWSGRPAPASSSSSSSLWVCPWPRRRTLRPLCLRSPSGGTAGRRCWSPSCPEAQRRTVMERLARKGESSQIRREKLPIELRVKQDQSASVPGLKMFCFFLFFFKIDIRLQVSWNSELERPVWQPYIRPFFPVWLLAHLPCDSSHWLEGPIS